MSLLSIRSLTRSLPLLPTPRRSPFAHLRTFSSSPSHLNATPDWQALIGGREVVERKKKEYENKYAKRLEEKAREKGVSVEVLLEEKRRVEKLEQGKAREGKEVGMGPVEAGSEEVKEGEGEVVRPPPSASPTGKSPRPPKKSSSPVKPLEDIMDLSKAASLSTPEISQLWTGYHQSKGFLSAAIPTEIYDRMIKLGKKYPMFVLPLTREGDAVEGTKEMSEGGTEMHLLQWAFLPPPPNIIEPIPSPSTVLFTPLGEYQSRQSYAQPYLILTHYTDLSLSHKVVLMRGEITDNVALNAVEAQILAVRLQLFYNNPTGALGGVGLEERERERQELLRGFHERPAEFQVDRLINLSWDLK